ncbi:MAG: NnrS family protein [Paracoccaceae bacterium]
MSTGTAEKKRSYTGPVFLSGGFRPFFLFGAIWAALAMVLWVAVITGTLELPTAFDPVDWHAHELMFGYGAAIVCGFLLTAVPNWTGRLPVMGWPLAVLAGLWVLGRVVVTFGAALPTWVVIIGDLSFLAALVIVIAREIWSGANWRNLPVVGLCLLLLAGNAAFHVVAAQSGVAASGIGARLGAGALVMLLSVIGGRVVPSFTRNWLARRGPGRMPTPINRYDEVTLGVSGLALAAWILVPVHSLTAAGLALAGLLQAIRLVRWAGYRTFAEPLVVVLHIAYAFVPVGFLLLATAWLTPSVPALVGVHAWMTGAVGLMTLAMMTRASLGHTGRELCAGLAETAIFGMALLAVLARIAAGLTGQTWALDLSGLAWIGAFGLFSVAYWPVLTGPRVAAKKPMRAPQPS